jgi:hypothetical protein
MNDFTKEELEYLLTFFTKQELYILETILEQYTAHNPWYDSTPLMDKIHELLANYCKDDWKPTNMD